MKFIAKMEAVTSAEKTIITLLIMSVSHKSLAVFTNAEFVSYASTRLSFIKHPRHAESMDASKQLMMDALVADSHLNPILKFVKFLIVLLLRTMHALDALLDII